MTFLTGRNTSCLWIWNQILIVKPIHKAWHSVTNTRPFFPHQKGTGSHFPNCFNRRTSPQRHSLRSWNENPYSETQLYTLTTLSTVSFKAYVLGISDPEAHEIFEITTAETKNKLLIRILTVWKSYSNPANRQAERGVTWKKLRETTQVYLWQENIPSKNKIPVFEEQTLLKKHLERKWERETMTWISKGTQKHKTSYVGINFKMIPIIKSISFTGGEQSEARSE